MRYLFVRALGLSAAVSLVFVPLSFGQEATADQPTLLEACTDPEHRQFDFWLGNWEVTDTAGSVVGTNRITRVASGCGLLESWRSGSSGYEGNSLNWYDPAGGRWYQRWVGLGVYLHLEGGIEDGNMVLSGPRQTAEGEVIDRITWTPMNDGRVRQLWEMSGDGGETWRVLFDGMYAKG